MYHAERMAEFALGLQFEDLPDDVRSTALVHIADTLA